MMMGYRIGLQCFSTIEQATDYSVSLIVPVISPEGKLYSPYKSGGKWYLEGNEIYLSFPQCSVKEQFNQGATLAAPFVMLFFMIWAFKTIGTMIKGSKSNDG